MAACYYRLAYAFYACSDRIKNDHWSQTLLTMLPLFTKLYEAADVGISFMFGGLADPSGPWGVIFAIKILPVIIFLARLCRCFFISRVIQTVVGGINKVVGRLWERPVLKHYVLSLIAF